MRHIVDEVAHLSKLFRRTANSERRSDNIQRSNTFKIKVEKFGGALSCDLTADNPTYW